MSKPTLNLPLSRAMLLFFLLVLAFSTIVVSAASRYFEYRSVTSMAEAEAHKTSAMVFESLYAVMKRGWGREDIDEVIGGLSKAMPDTQITLYRSRKVAELFGEGPHMIDQVDDEPLRQVTRNGEPELIDEATTLRFLHPLKAEQKCLGCHVNAELGDVNGVIDIRFPVERLRVPLEFMLDSVFLVFSLIFLVVVGISFVVVRQVLVKPIVELSRHMREIDELDDLSQRQHASPFAFRELTLLTDEFHYLLNRVAMARQELQEKSERDALTGLYNRRRIDELLDNELLRCERYRHPMSLLMLDLNRFKPINDIHGHEAGDAVLIAISQVLQDTLRESDVVARVGGDEFVVMATETGREEAARLAERLAEAVCASVTEYQGERLRVGVSVGYAVYPEDGRDREALSREADKAMYENKKLCHARMDAEGETA